MKHWLAWRFFRSHQRHIFHSLLRWVALVGIALGTTALVVVLSVMRGFNEELVDRLLGFNAHLEITLPRGEKPKEHQAWLEKMLSPHGVEKTIPFVEGEVILSSSSSLEETAQGIRFRGIPFHELLRMKRLELSFGEGLESQFSAIILGYDLAANLLVHPDFEDVVDAIAPLAEVGPTGELIPRTRRFSVAGLFRSRIYEYDNGIAFGEIDDAHALLGEQQTSGWRVWLQDPFQADRIVRELNLPDGWKQKSWGEQNQKLFAALRLERIAMGGVLVLLISVASFSIMGVTFLMTTAKRREIAILKVLGMSRAAIRALFVRQGMIMGLAGAGSGVILGVAICFLLKRFPFELPSSYYLDRLPVTIEPLHLLLYGAIGVAITTIATLYPAWEAAELSEAELLRYE